mmetsp:Transcript_598/g.837  ORF Transcript_598/g.837 Transcript_598/m.837 type:complete len:107 (+) Transcript_598:15-335(+)
MGCFPIKDIGSLSRKSSSMYGSKHLLIAALNCHIQWSGMNLWSFLRAAPNRKVPIIQGLHRKDQVHHEVVDFQSILHIPTQNLHVAPLLAQASTQNIRPWPGVLYR